MKELTPFEEFKQWLIEETRNKFLEEGLDEGLKQGLEQGRELGLEQGRKQGLKQGREQGRKEGASALLERQLVRRFGPLPQTVQKKLATASLAQVDAWGEALLEATSLQQVFESDQ